jgi:hypothetical protein
LPLTVRAGADIIRINPTGSGRYPTIQAAINAAGSGDEVVLEAGIYKGEGNYNLDFKGKAITLRSLKPDSDKCIRETTIDANGQGVIVRFVSDEGPRSVFEGFTLIPGDTSLPLRGIAGLFEFSEKAKPTTRRLRLAVPSSFRTPSTGPDVSDAELQQTEQASCGRFWNGNNPFHQPACTTDYYGSGDVDNDGNVTFVDASLAQEIADGSRAATVRADVDGSGAVDVCDVSLISSSLDGSLLPGWWNNLTGRAERDSWVSRFLDLDQTDKHTYLYSGFLCEDFAVQTFIHGAYYRDDFFYRNYNGGQTAFNLPVYYVHILGASISHAINAILVGDDPLDFDDWRFFEPQTDEDAHPGMWNMPYGCNVSIQVVSSMRDNRGLFYTTKVVFYVDETGWTLQEVSPELLLTRPAPPLTNGLDNHRDLWNPRVLPLDESEKVLVEFVRDDMTRTTDIHLADLSSEDPATGAPLVLESQYSRLLDFCKGPDGRIHMIWHGKPGYENGVFYAELDPNSSVLSNIARVSTGLRKVRMGRVEATANEIHIFWYEAQMGETPPTGIYWARYTEQTGWESAVNLAPSGWLYPYDKSQPMTSIEDSRDFLQYAFDTTVFDGHKIMIVWKQSVDRDVLSRVYVRSYDGQWAGTHFVMEDYVRGLDLEVDTSGILHLAYWLREGTTSYPGRGNLYHRTFEADHWSDPTQMDASNTACCPRMAAANEGRIYLVWEREVGDHIVPVLRKYEDGVWDCEQKLGVRPAADAWYPTAVAANGALAVTWSSRSADRVTIETQMIELNVGDLDHDGRVDFLDFAIFASAWWAIPGEPAWNSTCNLCQADLVIDFLDLKILAESWLEGTNP